MTLIEFLAPVKNSTLKYICISAMYFAERYKDTSALTVEQLRKYLTQARVKNAKTINLADVLSKSGDLVDSPGKLGKSRLWSLTTLGQQEVRKLHKLPESDLELEHDTSSLTALVAKITDDEVREYIEESVKCLSVGALKAAVVFLWTGAARVIQQRCLSHPLKDVNTALKKHYPKAKDVKKIDDFAYINDRVVLNAAQDLGEFDKAQTGTLIEALDLRNRCGHPSKYTPGPKKVSSFIEDLIGVVFP